jgi:hypothetical protein
MDPFYSTSGSSPPEGQSHGPARHEVPPEEQEPRPLPEDLIDALAALLAQALVNDIRQYPDLRDLSPSGTAVVAPPGAGPCPRSSAGHRHTSTRSRTRRPTHAS